MSGPIVRKYGFPNFEKIFGERPIEHGVEEPAPAEDRAGDKGPDASKPPATPPKQDAARPGDPKGSR